MRHYIKILSLFGVFLYTFLLSANLAWGFSVASVHDYSIHFAPGTAEIREESMPILQAVAATLKAARPLHVIIQGHADTLEKNRNVIDLSQHRAQSVKDLLVSWGIDSCRLTIEAFGPTQPVAANNTEEGRARNRRVEFKSFVPPPILEGVRQMPVEELEKKLEKKEPNEKNSGRFLVLARLNQVAYARQAVALHVETWSGPEETYPWVQGDPAEEKLSSDPPRLSAREAKQHLKKAIRYFSKVIHFPPGESAILGLPDYPARRKLKAYRGLVWCLWQSGENDKAKKVYPKYLEAAKALDQEEGGSNVEAACKMLMPVFGNIPDCEPISKK